MEIRLIEPVTRCVVFLAALAVSLAQTIQPLTDVIANEMLAAHNQIRSSVKLPPLTWSPKLADVARQWAEHLVATGKFEHRQERRFGENIFEIQGASTGARQVVAAWASEGKNYNAEQNSCRSGAVCGHYTQLVWRDTKEVGCGVARRSGREVWVCNYDPPGNIVGQRPY